MRRTRQAGVSPDLEGWMIMAVTVSLAPLARASRRDRRVTLLKELSLVSRDVDVLDGLEVPDELRPLTQTRGTARNLDVGLPGWQRGLGVAIALVVVVLMIMETSLLLALLLCLSAVTALVLATAAVAHALLTGARPAGTERR